MKEKLYDWDDDKNQRLKASHNISFEEIVAHIAEGQVLDLGGDS